VWVCEERERDREYVSACVYEFDLLWKCVCLSECVCGALGCRKVCVFAFVCVVYVSLSIGLGVGASVKSVCVCVSVSVSVLKVCVCECEWVCWKCMYVSMCAWVYWKCVCESVESKVLQKADSFVFPKIWNTASFEVIRTIETNRKFCNCKIFAKLNDNICKTFLALNVVLCFETKQN